tara:strand:- start:2905 stop:3336 length:432 start_codon:yes stop_codon:yes gene_type:complete
MSLDDMRDSEVSTLYALRAMRMELRASRPRKKAKKRVPRLPSDVARNIQFKGDSLSWADIWERQPTILDSQYSAFGTRTSTESTLKGLRKRLREPCFRRRNWRLVRIKAVCVGMSFEQWLLLEEGFSIPSNYGDSVIATIIEG